MGLMMVTPPPPSREKRLKLPPQQTNKVERILGYNKYFFSNWKNGNNLMEVPNEHTLLHSLFVSVKLQTLSAPYFHNADKTFKRQGLQRT